jgi:chromosome segregation ATPase
MKRILLPLALVFVVSAHAQTTNNTKVKIDPKNNKVSNPVVEKPKPKLMSRDELRACIDQQEANSKEADAIKAEQASYKANAEKLKAEKATVEAGEVALGKQISEMKAEKEGILATYAALTAEAPKLSKEDLKARNDAYQARTNAFNTSFDAVKAADAEQSGRRKGFSDKVDALDAQFKALEERTEKHFDGNDKWKAECQNKAYDENDEKAIRKEKAAAGK